MLSRSNPILRFIFSYILLFSLVLPDLCAAQDATPPTTSATPTSTSSSQSNTASSSARARSSVGSSGAPPDVVLDVPELSVGRIELNVDNLKADINLNAKIASLVTINAGVFLSIEKVNLTIADVNAQLQLIVRLGHLVDIVNRVFESLDLNPLLSNTVNSVTNALDPIVGAVDGLLGSITQGGNKLSFTVDNLGNIVQQVTGGSGGNPASSIVGNYLNNMTDTGVSETLQNGLTQKTFSYSPLNALVDITFNKAGQVVQAKVNKSGSGGGGSSSGGSASGSVAGGPTSTGSGNLIPTGSGNPVATDSGTLIPSDVPGGDLLPSETPGGDLLPSDTPEVL